MRKLAALILPLFTPALFLPAAAYADCSAEKNERPSIIVQGEGKVYAKPTLATVTIGVVSEAQTARQALAANSTAMAELMKTVSENDIAERDVQTSNFSVSPLYSNEPGRIARIRGYSVQNSVTVHVRKIPQVGPLLDAVVTSGANRVDGVSFTVDDRSKLLDEARKEAMADARRKAALYAAAGGVQLGKVLSVIEGSAVQPPRPMFHMAAAAMIAPTPIAAGEEELTVHVTAVFAIQ